MKLNEPLLAELSREAATARRMLERLPQTQFAWRPHERSMTLGRLTTHIAEIPGWVGSCLDKEGFDFSGDHAPRTIQTGAELLAFFDQNVATATQVVKGLSNERLLGNWRLTRQGQLIVEMPRIGVVRALLLNHFIHHRGQLSVYMRLLNVPVPSIYGPSADEPM